MDIEFTSSRNPEPPSSPDLPAKFDGAYRIVPDATGADGRHNGMHAFAAALAQLSYCDPERIEQLLIAEGATNIVSLYDGDDLYSGQTYAFAFVLERRAWLTFRGTNDVNDWERNIRAYPFYHSGFRKIWRSIRHRVTSWSNSIAGHVDGFVVAGHSLGGAIATLAAYDLASDRGLPIEALVTFAAPRVGSPWFAKAFDKQTCNLPDAPATRLGDRSHRHVASGDLVPRVPPFWLGFKHVGSSHSFPSLNAIDLVSSPLWQGTPDLSTLSRLRLAVRDTLDMMPVFGLPMILRSIGWTADLYGFHKMDGYSACFPGLASFRGRIEEIPKPQLQPRKRWTSMAIVAAAIVALVLAAGAMIVLLWQSMGQYTWSLVGLFAIYFAISVYGRFHDPNALPTLRNSLDVDAKQASRTLIEGQQYHGDRIPAQSQFRPSVPTNQDPADRLKRSGDEEHGGSDNGG